MSWKPFVVGVDASSEAAAAAAFALEAATRAGTTCHLVHAVRHAMGSPHAPEAERSHSVLLEQARAQLAGALGEAVPAQALSSLVARLGSAHQVIRDFAAACGAELIVLGGKEHSMLGRWIGGSTSLDVVRTTDLPLLVTAGPAPAMRRVLVAVDLSGAARPTLAAAARYAALFGAEVRALSVHEPIPVIPEVTPPYDVAQYYATAQELLDREVWPYIQGDVEKVVRHGMAVETILAEATDWHADLLVVGSHGKGWAERMLVGSVTERLLNQLPTSLLVVPTRVSAAVPVVRREAINALEVTVAIA
ncbi:MAG TPA: universal stress protein [Gemmatimonadales bacterium]|nr:universal stress protein [Gemmatimonadales bacterium]